MELPSATDRYVGDSLKKTPGSEDFLSSSRVTSPPEVNLPMPTIRSERMTNFRAQYVTGQVELREIRISRWRVYGALRAGTAGFRLHQSATIPA
jgi:hypothetical protein